jgi:hypothetical protein
METGYVVAAAIAAGPATIAAWSSLRTSRKVKTNHGKNIGTHVEDLVEWTGNMTAWALAHQGSDNDLREALGLDRIELPFPHIEE